MILLAYRVTAHLLRRRPGPSRRIQKTFHRLPPLDGPTLLDEILGPWLLVLVTSFVNEPLVLLVRHLVTVDEERAEAESGERIQPREPGSRIPSGGDAHHGVRHRSRLDELDVDLQRPKSRMPESTVFAHIAVFFDSEPFRADRNTKLFDRCLPGR